VRALSNLTDTPVKIFLLNKSNIYFQNNKEKREWKKGKDSKVDPETTRKQRQNLN